MTSDQEGRHDRYEEPRAPTTYEMNKKGKKKKEQSLDGQTLFSRQRQNTIVLYQVQVRYR